MSLCVPMCPPVTHVVSLWVPMCPPVTHVVSLWVPTCPPVTHVVSPSCHRRVGAGRALPALQRNSAVTPGRSDGGDTEMDTDCGGTAGGDRDIWGYMGIYGGIRGYMEI